MWTKKYLVWVVRGVESRMTIMVNLSIQYNHILIDGIIFYLCAFMLDVVRSERSEKVLCENKKEINEMRRIWVNITVWGARWLILLWHIIICGKFAFCYLAKEREREICNYCGTLIHNSWKIYSATTSDYKICENLLPSRQSLKT